MAQKPCRKLAFFLYLFVLVDYTKKPLKHSFKGFCLCFGSHCLRVRAENETRTRDPNLGKVVLYKFLRSHSKIVSSLF